MLLNSNLSPSASRLSFPLPLTKRAFNFPLYVSSEPPYRPPPIVYQEPKKKRLWPWLLPIAGVGADLAFNQGRLSKGVLDWLMPYKSPADRWVAPNVVQRPPTDTSGGIFHGYKEPGPITNWIGSGINKVQNYLFPAAMGQSLATSAVNTAANANNIRVLKSIPGRNLLSQAGTAVKNYKYSTKFPWLTKLWKAPGRALPFVGAAGAAADAATDPIKQELAREGKMYGAFTPAGAAATTAARYGLATLGGPVALGANMAYDLADSQLTPNVQMSQGVADLTRDKMDTALNAYRAARGSAANMQEAARGLKSYYRGMEALEKPNDSWWNPRAWLDYFAGEGTSGRVNLENPAYAALVKRMQNAR